MSPLPLAVPLAVSISGTARVVVLCGRVVGSTVVLCSVTGTASGSISGSARVVMLCGSAR